MRKSKQAKLDKKLRPWLEYYTDIPANMEYPSYSMYDKVLETAQKYPDNMAYSYFGSKVTYKEFIEKVKETARALKNYGIKEDDRITICMPNTPEAIITVYATNMIGAICNMVHPLSSEKELEYYINAADSRFIFVIDAVFEKVYKIKDSTNLNKIIVAKVSEGMSKPLSGMYWLINGRKIKFPKHDTTVIMWQEFLKNSRLYQGEIYFPR